MKRTILSIIVFWLAMTIGSAAQAEESTITFSDIETHWAKNDILYLAEQGYISGYADGTFRPEEKITRAEFSHMLAKIMNIGPDSETYPKAAGHWAKDSINALVEDEIIGEWRDLPEFILDEPIPRWEITTMIGQGLASKNYMYAQLLYMFERLKHEQLMKILPFKEQHIGTVSGQRAGMIHFAGILKGRPDGSFDATGLATRAEAAALLKRFIDVRHTTPELNSMLELFEGYTDIQTKLREEYKVASAINEFIDERIKPGDTDVQKLLKLTEFISEKVKMHEDPMPNGWLVTEGFTPWEALVEGQAIATGYAYTTKHFLNALGFENQIVEMTGERYVHSATWNLVKLSDGRWYHMHTARNDTGAGRYRLTYFLLTDQEAEKLGMSWSRAKHPKSAEEPILEKLHDPNHTIALYSPPTNSIVYKMIAGDQSMLGSINLSDFTEKRIMDCKYDWWCSEFVTDDHGWIYVYNTFDDKYGIYTAKIDGSSSITLFKEAGAVEDLKLNGNVLEFTYYDREAGERVPGQINLRE